MFIFYCETHYLQITSLAAIFNFYVLEYLIPHKHTLKFYVNVNIFHEDIKENAIGCFFSEHSVVLLQSQSPHQLLTFSF